MTSPPPWALFILVPLTNDELNDRLVRAEQGGHGAGFQIWVATKNYDDIPRPQEVALPDGTTATVASDGTKAPQTQFEFPWLGSNILECAKWLRKAAADASCGSRKNFLAIDQHSRDEDTMLMCRSFGLGAGEIEVDYFPQPTKIIVISMYHCTACNYDEVAEGYQTRARIDGTPDRSKVVLYSRDHLFTSEH